MKFIFLHEIFTKCKYQKCCFYREQSVKSCYRMYCMQCPWFDMFYNRTENSVFDIGYGLYFTSETKHFLAHQNRRLIYKINSIFNVKTLNIPFFSLWKTAVWYIQWLWIFQKKNIHAWLITIVQKYKNIFNDEFQFKIEKNILCWTHWLDKKMKFHKK